VSPVSTFDYPSEKRSRGEREVRFGIQREVNIFIPREYFNHFLDLFIVETKADPDDEDHQSVYGRFSPPEAGLSPRTP
jgi:hypothetical protein